MLSFVLLPHPLYHTKITTVQWQTLRPVPLSQPPPAIWGGIEGCPVGGVGGTRGDHPRIIPNNTSTRHTPTPDKQTKPTKQTNPHRHSLARPPARHWKAVGGGVRGMSPQAPNPNPQPRPRPQHSGGGGGPGRRKSAARPRAASTSAGLRGSGRPAPAAATACALTSRWSPVRSRPSPSCGGTRGGEAGVGVGGEHR